VTRDDFVRVPLEVGYGTGETVNAGQVVPTAHDLDLIKACEDEGIVLTHAINATLAFTYVKLPNRHPIFDWYTIVTSQDSQSASVFSLLAYIIDPATYIETGDFKIKARSFVAIDEPEIKITLSLADKQAALDLHRYTVSTLLTTDLAVDRWQSNAWGKVIAKFTGNLK